MTKNGNGLKVLGVFFGMLSANAMSGQILHPDGPLPSFEVATIKPWKPSLRPLNAPIPVKMDPGHAFPQQRTDRVQFIGQIELLIMAAYNLPIGSERRIIHGPKWVGSEADRYEVQAKIDEATFAAIERMTPERQHREVSLLEQSLLAERFKLQVHFERQGEAPVYALTAPQGAAKLIPAKEGEATTLSFTNNEITAQAVSLDEFAQSPLWTPIGERYVIDRTGITGKYDFHLKWRSGHLDGSEETIEEKDLPPLFDAIREQLGLRVIDAKAPLEVIVIDRIDRPSRN